MENGDIKHKKQLPNAHLRDSNYQNRCRFVFYLKYSTEHFSIDEELQAVRQISEPVYSLLEHIKNKVIFIIQKYKKAIAVENEADDVKDIHIPISLKQGNKEVGAKITLKEIFAQDYKLVFSIFNLSFTVLINCPLITLIKLPEVLYAGHTIHANVRAIHTDLKYCKYCWYVSKNKETWIVVGDNYNYSIKSDEVDNYIKLIVTPHNLKLEGIPYEIISQNVVIQLPQIPNCPFEDRHKSTSEKLAGNEFRMVSYNILSSRYTYNQFEYCNPLYLDINYRKKLLLKEICGYNGDIICLQEVDASTFSYYFKNEFRKMNYGCRFNEKGYKIPEGMAIMFNKDRFSLVGDGQIVLKKEVLTNECLKSLLKIIKSSKEVGSMFMKQATSMMFCKLKLKDTNKLIIVANTHLYYHPDAKLVRNLQIFCCLHYLKRLLRQEQHKNKFLDISVILCGDYNSEPDSDVIKFMTEGVLEYKDEDGYSSSVHHTFQFESACGIPEFTNYTDDFKACLDYIFYEKRSISVTAIAPFPHEESLAEHIALPSQVYPSDHLALVADLKFN